MSTTHSTISLVLILLASAIGGVPAAVIPRDTEFTNPILPGHHSDPSCTSVGDTFFCTTSTFNLFPGLPVYASKDLINWKHISNAIHSEDQVPYYSELEGQQEGIFAPTLRYHDGVLYIIVAFLGTVDGLYFLLFNSSDPYDPLSWGPPVQWQTPDLDSFDPDIFWDSDGQAYVTVHVFDIVGNNQYPINVQTGEFGENYNLWNGTGNIWPEGPHMYKKDNYYYLMLAEGGTGSNHQVTISRSSDIKGPYDSYAENPILTNANSTQYFQAVGHADLFQDVNGNWWSTALSIRGGPDNLYYPMGRETVLTPVSWPEGDWPHPEPVRGRMSGPLPPPSRDIPGSGVWLKDGDDYETFDGPDLPIHFYHYLFPPQDLYEISDGRLQVNPSVSNITGTEDFNATFDRISLIVRRQTDTLFTHGVTMDFSPESEGDEAGMTLFLIQNQHADLSIVYLEGQTHLRFRITGIGAEIPYERDTVTLLASNLQNKSIALQIQPVSQESYVFSYGPVGGPMGAHGTTDSSLVSGGNGSFVGSYVGVYATSNGGSGSTPAYFSSWKYEGQGQQIDYGEVVKS